MSYETQAYSAEGGEEGLRLFERTLDGPTERLSVCLTQPQLADVRQQATALAREDALKALIRWDGRIGDSHQAAARGNALHAAYPFLLTEAVATLGQSESPQPGSAREFWSEAFPRQAAQVAMGRLTLDGTHFSHGRKLLEMEPILSLSQACRSLARKVEGRAGREPDERVDAESIHLLLKSSIRNGVLQALIEYDLRAYVGALATETRPMGWCVGHPSHPTRPYLLQLDPSQPGFCCVPDPAELGRLLAFCGFRQQDVNDALKNNRPSGDFPVVERAHLERAIGYLPATGGRAPNFALVAPRGSGHHTLQKLLDRARQDLPEREDTRKPGELCTIELCLAAAVPVLQAELLGRTQDGPLKLSRAHLLLRYIRGVPFAQKSLFTIQPGIFTPLGHLTNEEMNALNFGTTIRAGLTPVAIECLSAARICDIVRRLGAPATAERVCLPTPLPVQGLRQTARAAAEKLASAGCTSMAKSLREAAEEQSAEDLLRTLGRYVAIIQTQESC